MYKTTVCAIATLLLIAFSPLRGSVRSIQSHPPAFEVASIKPGTPSDRSGKVARMRSAHEFVVLNYSVKDLIGFAYDLPLARISGGPSWTEGDMFNILAGTPGDGRPTQSEQMAMVGELLEERFRLQYHVQPRELPVYRLIVTKNGPKLKESLMYLETPSPLTNVVFPGSRIEIHARGVAISEFASLLQRAVFDRAVLDQTNLTGRYDFDLAWSYDDTQFGGKLPPINVDQANRPSLFAAVQTELGLTLESSRAQVDTIIIDSVQRPSEN